MKDTNNNQSIDRVQSIPLYMDALDSPLGVFTSIGVSIPPMLARDRFGQLNHFSTFRLSNKQDRFPIPISTPLNELLDKRGAELAQKTCFLPWSGGVDSTTILLSLIKNGIHKEDLEILYTIESMVEYPRLYRWLSDNKYKLHRVPYQNQLQWVEAIKNSQADCILSGGHGGDLSSPNSWFHHNDQSGRMYHAPLETFLFMGHKCSRAEHYFPTLSIEQAFDYADIYREAARKVFGVELKEACELSWFAHFCLAFRHYDIKLILTGSPAADKVVDFFSTDYFQDWAVGQFEKISAVNIYRDGPKNYKREFKEYCYSVFPDLQYLLHKGKVSSYNATNIRDTPQGKTRLVIQLEDGASVVYEIPKRLAFNPRFLKLFVNEFKKSPDEIDEWANLPVDMQTFEDVPMSEIEMEYAKIKKRTTPPPKYYYEKF